MKHVYIQLKLSHMYINEHVVTSLLVFTFIFLKTIFMLFANFPSVPLVNLCIHLPTYSDKNKGMLVLMRGSQGPSRAKQTWSMSDSFFTKIRIKIPMDLSQKRGWKWALKTQSFKFDSQSLYLLVTNPRKITSRFSLPSGKMGLRPLQLIKLLEYSIQ